MDTWKLCGLALLAVVAFSLVRQMGRDFELPMRLTAAVIFWGALAVTAVPLVASLRDMLEEGALGEYGGLLMTALGLSVVSGACADLCRECRETALATYVETAARVEILILCLAPVGEVLSAVSELMAR